MRTRAAAALQKVLTFQDVRERVADVSPFAVAPLVELLRQEGSSKLPPEAASKRKSKAQPHFGAGSRQGSGEQQPRAGSRVLRQQEHDQDKGKSAVRSLEGMTGKGEEDGRSPNAPYQLDNKVIHAGLHRSRS